MIAVLLLCGCESHRLQDARQKFYSGRYGEAAEVLGEHTPSTRNRLLFLMERGLALHTAGRYRESTRVLLMAAELLPDLETISASRSTVSLATNDRVRIYRGEEFERVLVHTYLVMNFLLQGNYEDALVESKRALKRLKDRTKNYEQHPFTRYLAAVCFELLGQYQDAAIEYRKVHELVPQWTRLKSDLMRTADLLGRQDEFEKWGALPGKKWTRRRGQSEVILFIQTGRGPVKESSEIFVPPSHRVAVPVYTTGRGQVQHATIALGGNPLALSRRLLDMNLVAKKTLDDHTGRILLKEAVRKGVQEVISEQSDNVWIEIATRAFFFAISGADTRSWQTLPRDIQIARFPIKPGTYDFDLSFVGYGENVIGHHIFRQVIVPEKRPAFLNIRVFL